MTDQSFQIAKRIIETATQRNLTIATAESCTGGWIGKALTDIPGSSSVFMGSLVAYSNDIKRNLLGVPEDLLVKFGAVSQAVALEMSKNCLQSFGVDIALSVTGIAGPGGGRKGKPVGLVHMGLATRTYEASHDFKFENLGRDCVRRDALLAGLLLMLEAAENT